MTHRISIKIFQHQFQIACAEGEVESLMQAAQQLEQNIDKIRSDTGEVDLVRLALMGALYHATETTIAKKPATPKSDKRQIDSLIKRVDKTLAGL